MKSMKRNSTKLLNAAVLLLLAWSAAQGVRADTLVPNGGFEEGTTGWTIFVPEESKDKNCRFDVAGDAPHSGSSAARFQSDDFARFGIGAPVIPVQAGERYRVSVWVRIDPAAQVRPKAPGFAIRLNLRQGDSDAPGGHLFIVPGNRVSRDIPADPGADLTKDWTHVEAVVEIPGGVDAIGPSLFSWWTSGTLYADDFTIEKVDAATAVTPLGQKTP
jgi:hypothetical protein